MSYLCRTSKLPLAKLFCNLSPKRWSISSKSLSFASENLTRLPLLSVPPNDFVNYLKARNVQRCYLVYDKTGGLLSSHSDIEEFKQFFVKDKIDFHEHEAVFLQIGQETDILMGAFIWRTFRGQACGGVRLWDYEDMESYLRDGLRLAQGMGVKSALAGLWVGGGKGVIQIPRDSKHLDPKFRAKMFQDYGKFLSSLNGCYIAAEDVGVNVEDMENCRDYTRYITCIPEEKGGSGNPSVATGKGVICAMEAAVSYLEGGATLEGKTVAIQGAGNVAIVIIEELLKRGVKHIYASDCNEQRVEEIRSHFSDKLYNQLTLEMVPVGDTGIMEKECDILSPCALGNVLNKETIPKIKAKIICGAANNQLGSVEDSQLLKERGITYVADFLANRMGIVNCSNETYGRLPEDPAINCHFSKDWEHSVYNTTIHTLEKAAAEDITTNEAALRIAEEESKEVHPLWPNRTQQIIQALVKYKWHQDHSPTLW